MTKVTHSNPAAVSPQLLTWAIGRASSSTAELAKSAGTSESVVNQWLQNGRQPTFSQARKAAAHLRVPFGFLFLPQPPPDTLPIPDFRVLGGHIIGEISPDLRDVILATMRRQDWLAEYRKDQGAPLVSVVGIAKGMTSPVQIAAKMRQALGLTRADQHSSNSDDFMRQLVDKAESLGISVLRSGIVGLNTHRPLNVREFRGFSLSNRRAPFVFINGADAKTGQVFTLIHELAHIWLGQTGISGSLRQEGATERLCNEVAAEVLVPATQFARAWRDSDTFDENIQRLARQFRVSRYVIAIRAFESGQIDRPTLDGLLNLFDSNVRTKKKSSGGDFYKTTIARNGRRFTDGVMGALSQQRVLVRDAASLLEVRPAHLERLARELAQRG